MIIGTRNKYMAQRMPAQTPNHAIMCFLHASHLTITPDIGNSKQYILEFEQYKASGQKLGRRTYQT